MNCMTKVQVLAGAMVGFYLFATTSKLALGPNQPPIQWVSGSLTLEVKQPGSETVSQYSAEAKNLCSYTTTPQYVFMAPYLIKQWMHLHGMVLS
jgi:hypothetical protein